MKGMSRRTVILGLSMAVLMPWTSAFGAERAGLCV